MSEHETNKRHNAARQVEIRTGSLSPEAKSLFDSVALRAYEIFEAKGRPAGLDLENWIEAEDQLFEKTSLSLAESNEELSIFADVRDYTSKELEVDVEPRRITIIGKHDGSAKSEDASVARKSRLLLSVLLPVEIDPQYASAYLKRGVLELDLRKAERTKDAQLLNGRSSQVV